MKKLKEIFEANSYQIKVDKYPFTDDYETCLGIQEALMSAKGWLLEKLKEREPDIKESKQPNTIRNRQYWNGYELAFDELLEELKDVFLPTKNTP